MNFNSPKPKQRVVAPSSPMTPQKRSSPDNSCYETPKQFTVAVGSSARANVTRDTTANQTLLETPSPRKMARREPPVVSKASFACEPENAISSWTPTKSPSPVKRFSENVPSTPPSNKEK